VTIAHFSCAGGKIVSLKNGTIQIPSTIPKTAISKPTEVTEESNRYAACDMHPSALTQQRWHRRHCSAMVCSDFRAAAQLNAIRRGAAAAGDVHLRAGGKLLAFRARSNLHLAN